MIVQEQLDKWVAGESVHNGASRSEGECCPDFSCCFPVLLAPKAEREAFARALPEARGAMLGVFLQRAIVAHTKKKIIVIDGHEGRQAQ